MELMPGTTLQDLVEKGRTAQRRGGDRQDPRRHRRPARDSPPRIVHRDVKPSNCLMDSDGRAKIGDFGLSRSLVRADALTRTGTFIGTPLFAAPEQIKAETVGPRSDVYSVAATLYYLLTGGAVPGGDTAATLARIVSDPAPPMRSVRKDLPAALDRVVLRGLERDPASAGATRRVRTALLPFVPGRLSIGGLGVRFGAFAIDYALLFLLAMPFMLTLLSEAARAPGWQMQISTERQVFQMLVGRSSGCCISSAARPCGVARSASVAGPARVQAARRERPGLVNAVLRTGLFYLL